jgi:hypothetical protein
MASYAANDASRSEADETNVASNTLMIAWEPAGSAGTSRCYEQSAG